MPWTRPENNTKAAFWLGAGRDRQEGGRWAGEGKEEAAVITKVAVVVAVSDVPLLRHPMTGHSIYSYLYDGLIVCYSKNGPIRSPSSFC